MASAFSEELAKCKLRRRLTNPRFAEFLGVPLRTLEDWESGKHVPPSYVQAAVLQAIKESEEEEN